MSSQSPWKNYAFEMRVGRMLSARRVQVVTSHFEMVVADSAGWIWGCRMVWQGKVM
jgi:hypothetical protein